MIAWKDYYMYKVIQIIEVSNLVVILIYFTSNPGPRPKDPNSPRSRVRGIWAVGKSRLWVAKRPNPIFRTGKKCWSETPSYWWLARYVHFHRPHYGWYHAEHYVRSLGSLNIYGGSNISSLAWTRTVALVSLVCVFASIFVMDDIKLIMMLGRQVIVFVSSSQAGGRNNLGALFSNRPDSGLNNCGGPNCFSSCPITLSHLTLILTNGR